MPVILGGLYGMRRSEILGLRWRNVDLENNTFDVSEQLPFKVPPKTKVIEEMAPPKSNGRKLPITDLPARSSLNSLPCKKHRKNRRQRTGDFYTMGEVLGHTLAGIGVSLGLSMNFEAVTARYVDVRLERKKEVLDVYNDAVGKTEPPKAEKAEPKKPKGKAKKKGGDLNL